MVQFSAVAPLSPDAEIVGLVPADRLLFPRKGNSGGARVIQWVDQDPLYLVPRDVLRVALWRTEVFRHDLRRERRRKHARWRKCKFFRAYSIVCAVELRSFGRNDSCSSSFDSTRSMALVNPACSLETVPSRISQRYLDKVIFSAQNSWATRGKFNKRN